MDNTLHAVSKRAILGELYTGAIVQTLGRAWRKIPFLFVIPVQ